MNETTDSEIYVADRPITEMKEDRFKRYEFSKRIAETILQRKSSDSIVFGLFGEWGEGKSSVLNFISKELSNDNAVVQITLNPWRYSDEDSLLKNFFEKIADALQVKLYTRSEKTGEMLKKVAKVASVTGYDGTGIGTLLSDTDIEEFKGRVDKFLRETNKKVVIFVDDIDRLDKHEIYALFRLVKLTADFSNTVYILSFDEQMVATAIAERYGNGELKSGQSFLEKIIQVPLNLPKAHPESLKKFCFNLMEAAIDFDKLAIQEDEMRRFVSQFTANVLLRLNTPRLAVRYSNALSFSLPLLYGEANMVDLMLIEALKIFYPGHYELIKHNPNYFIKAFEDGRDTGDKKNRDVFLGILDELDITLSQAERYAVRNLIGDLFPHIDKLFSSFRMMAEKPEKWYAAKRIASPDYFDRYFSYSVIDGDISDIRFIAFIGEIKNEKVDHVVEQMRDILSVARPGNFIQKLNVRLSEYTWAESKVIIRAICECAELFPGEAGFFYGYGSSQEQIAMFIYQLINKFRSDQDDTAAFAMDVMRTSKDFAFTYSVNNWLRTGETVDDKIFTQQQYDDMALILRDRAVRESGDQSIFEVFPDYIYYLLPAWRDKDKKGLTRYIKQYLARNKGNVLNFIRSFISLRISLNGDNIKYRGDLEREAFDFLETIYNPLLVYKAIIKNFTLKELLAENPKWEQGRKVVFSDINMSRQFLRYVPQAVTPTQTESLN